jgi:alpha-D-xyloside xylohydrolase
VGSRTDKPDYDYGDGVTLQVYQLEAGRQVSVDIPTLDGTIETRFEVRREGNSIQIDRQGSSKAWNVLLVGVDLAEKSDSMEIIKRSTSIKADFGANQMVIRLED